MTISTYYKIKHVPSGNYISLGGYLVEEYCDREFEAHFPSIERAREELELLDKNFKIVKVTVTEEEIR